MKRFTPLSLILCFLLCLSTFIGCEPATEPVTEADGTGTTEATDTEAATDEPEGWEPPTGKFNEGIVDYVKETKTEVIPAYPDEKLGKIMSPGDEGVISVFHADFEDNDPTCGGNASFRVPGSMTATLPGYVECRDGKLYIPFNESTSTMTGADWNTWSPAPPASVKTSKQAQISLQWTIVSAGNGAWLNPIIGCYLSNYAGKIPDAPGDGLWISFNSIGNAINIYHPDKASWPQAWAAVPIERGILRGEHKIDVITSSDHSTYVYLTQQGRDEARLICTVKFEDNMIRAYNEANELVAEDSCTTNALQGEHFSIFPHGGGGAIINSVDILTASKGETITETTVTATPTAGNSLGLDITDKKDLVSICYSVWFDAILGKSGGTVDEFYDVSEVLAGNQQWGPVPSFHYWAKPALGYYSSSNTDVIRTHMTQLYTAGVDFIIIDLTNAHDGYLATADWMNYIQRPMDAILSTIMQMRAEGLGTPYVVFWVGDWVGESNGPLYQKIYDVYHANESYEDCFVYWDGKPLLLTAYTQPEDFPLKDKNLFTVRSMWNYLDPERPEGQWSYMAESNYGQYAKAKDGSAEQMNVAAAAFPHYMSQTDTAHGRQGGLFWYCQWYSAFEVRPKIVTLTWWNEWTAQRLRLESGEHVFTDNFNQEYSRDIEPMEGGHGDQYYKWMIDYIYAYKNGEECPLLVEDSRKAEAAGFLEEFKQGYASEDAE